MELLQSLEAAEAGPEVVDGHGIPAQSQLSPRFVSASLPGTSLKADYRHLQDRLAGRQPNRPAKESLHDLGVGQLLDGQVQRDEPVGWQDGKQSIDVRLDQGSPPVDRSG